MPEKGEKRNSNAAKPVSLHPLKFEQAVDKLLKVEPEKKVAAKDGQERSG